ncbi:DUF952 domain-containing protein [Limimaricola hongkongensis]|uniref:DUF952 domain-containing protein n=1 Tax=Limimaricola hongkongensis DSM 17492 TaxID=1122180 RepID=A0A017HD47_9RHOB|nr:DUF952 domain-containing protein [Limimaricola hongkongensis]EYD72306.1 hypothetical protein Lokhon_01099 [Limimaricola hongkongensis DSM 17492]
MLIYKIFRAPEWAELEQAGQTRGAPVDLADGYIHFSTAAQARETAAKHFAGEDGLILAAIEAGALGDDLTWEPSRGGQLFPHLYRPLRRAEVLWSKDLPLVQGRHDFPEEMA